MSEENQNPSIPGDESKATSELNKATQVWTARDIEELLIGIQPPDSDASNAECLANNERRRHFNIVSALIIRQLLDERVSGDEPESLDANQRWIRNITPDSSTSDTGLLPCPFCGKQDHGDTRTPTSDYLQGMERAAKIADKREGSSRTAFHCSGNQSQRYLIGFQEAAALAAAIRAEAKQGEKS